MASMLGVPCYKRYSKVLMIPRENIFQNSEEVFSDLYIYVFYEKFETLKLINKILGNMIEEKLRGSKKTPQRTISDFFIDA